MKQFQNAGFAHLDFSLAPVNQCKTGTKIQAKSYENMLYCWGQSICYKVGDARMHIHHKIGGRMQDCILSGLPCLYFGLRYCTDTAHEIFLWNARDIDVQIS